MIVGLAVAALVSTVVAGALWWHRRQSRDPDERRVWEVTVPRGARFGRSEAEAWFTALAPLLPQTWRPPFVELRGEGGVARLFVGGPRWWEEALRAHTAAYFPGARLEEESEHVAVSAGLSLRLEKPPLFPLRLAGQGEPDPLLGLVGLLLEQGGRAGLRLSWGREPEGWRDWASEALAAAKAGNAPPPFDWRFRLLRLGALLQHAADSRDEIRPLSAPATLAAAVEKARGRAYASSLLAWAEADSPDVGAARAAAIADYLAEAFRDPAGNSLASEPVMGTPAGPARLPRLVLSAAELAALFHVPPDSGSLIPGRQSRVVAPPPEIARSADAAPDDGVELGEALALNGPVRFGISATERRLHLYVVGKTGSGKSTLLAQIARQDLEAGRGIALIDPHGDLAERVLALVPKRRYGEVLYFNPADADFPVAFNPLHCPVPARRPLVASGVVGVFKKLYGDSWGPRLEHFLRNTVLALLETPAPSLLLIPRLLGDDSYRRSLLAEVRDPVLRTFFLEEYERYDPRWRAEAVSPILNKVGQFLASPVVRNVVGPTGPGFDLRALMDNGGVFIANLASGRIGEDNAGMLGGLLVSAFQLAAMSRADAPEAKRRDFYLLVDEFQKVGTEAFASILSEARKYGLCLTVAHQYLDQVPPEMSDAVFGNAGSLVAFRVGQADTVRLAREFTPGFDAQDLVSLDAYHFCVRLTREGRALTPFSARTVPLWKLQWDTRRVVQLSRQRWARSRAEVELEVADLWEGRTD